MSDIEIHFKNGTTKPFAGEAVFNERTLSVEYEGYETHFPIADVESVVIKGLAEFFPADYYVADPVSEQARLAAEFLNSK